MKDLTKRVVPVAAMVAILAASGAASLRAQNLVFNPGFEAGNTGWSFGGTCSPPLGDPYTLPAATGAVAYDTPHSGSYLMWFGAVGCTATVYQSLSTVVGQTYNVDFWLQVATGWGYVPNSFQADINGSNVLFGPAQVANNPWQDFTSSFVGTGNDVLTFSGWNTPGGTELDDVSVTPTVPEPASLALLATGLLGIGGALRRFRRKQNA